MTRISLACCTSLLCALTLTRSVPAHVEGDVAFIREGNIWLCKADDTNPRQLTSEGGYTDLSWSPDGKRLAATRLVREGEPRVYVVDGATGQATNLVPNQRAQGPDWHPSGDLIAYCTSRAKGTYEMGTETACFVVEPDGTNRRSVYVHVSDGPLYATHCRWHPDGASILLFACFEDGPANTDLHAVIDSESGRELPAERARLIGLVDAWGRRGDPAMASEIGDLRYSHANGGWWAGLVVHRVGDGHSAVEFPSALVIARNDGSGRRVLLDGEDIASLAWTAGADALLCTMAREGTEWPDLKWDTYAVAVPRVGKQLWMADARSAELCRPFGAAIASAADTGRSSAQHATPPAGGRVVFIRDGNVWIANTDGSEQRPVTSDGQCEWPALRPGGALVAYERMPGFLPEVWLVGLDGKGARKAPGGDCCRMPEWSSDGRFLYCVRLRQGRNSTGRSDIVQIDVGTATSLVVAHDVRYDFASPYGPSGDQGGCFMRRSPVHLWNELVRRTGTAQEVLFVPDHVGNWAEGCVLGLSVSPGGEHVAFVQVGGDPISGDEEGWRLGVVDTTTRKARYLIEESEGSSRRCSWLPDGSAVLFDRWPDGDEGATPAVWCIGMSGEPRKVIEDASQAACGR